MAKKSKTKKQKLPKRPRQADLPSVEGPGISVPHIAEIEDIAEQYVSVRDQRMVLTTQEVEARGRLATVMHNHNLTRYPYDGKIVICEPGKEKLKVKTVNGPDDLEGDDDVSG